jgi:hypothetical protein
MSWSLNVGTVRPATAEAVRKAAEHTLADLRAKGPSYAAQFDQADTRQEVADQIEAGLGAAAVLLGGLGGDDEIPEEVTVSLYGHANPGHQPRPGWANETITVTVTTATPAGAGG